MLKMRFCSNCQSYTLHESHCGAATLSAHPPKFNPNDPYGEYRRKARYGA